MQGDQQQWRGGCTGWPGALNRYFFALVKASCTGIRRVFADLVFLLELAALDFTVAANIHCNFCHLGKMRRVVAGKLLNRSARGEHIVYQHGAFSNFLVALDQQFNAMLQACLAFFNAI
jgi:hypothetical protein